MVVVARQPLGELVAGEPLRAEMMGEDACLFEHRQRPVQRRERDGLTDHVGQLGCGHGTGRPGQRVDDRLPTLGVPDVVVEKLHLDLTIEIRFGHLPLRMIMILIVMITILISRLKSGMTAILAAGLVVVAACGAEEQGSSRLTVVATTSIWGDVVARIVGEDAEVEVLIPRNADAHDFQVTSRQAASLLEADLVIANGLGLEENLHDVLESAERDGANVLELAPLLDPLRFGVDETHEDDADHEQGDLDPHVWFDPDRIALAAEAIADELVNIEPSVDWEARASDYTAELAAADDEIQSLLSSVPDERRKLVTNHDALGYFAERYGYEVLGVVIPGGSTLGDPSSAELAELVETIESEGVGVIFTETSEPGRLAEAVAAEVGRDIDIVALFTESLGDPGTPAGTLTGMLIENARLISAALG